ncbi:MAG: hypothetical protein WBB76_01560 [Gaiellaceae bacterium]
MRAAAGPATSRPGPCCNSNGGGGHTRAGNFEGSIGGVPIFNVAVRVMGRDFFVFELDGANVRAAA